MKKTIIFILFLTVLKLHSQESIFENWYIGDTKRACQLDSYVTSCYLYKTNPDSSYKTFPYEIKGFFYEPGFDYLITVELKKLQFMEGNRRYDYVYHKTLSKKRTLITTPRILYHNTWQLLTITKDSRQKPAKKMKATIQFDSLSNTMTVFGGCKKGVAVTNLLDGFLEIIDIKFSPSDTICNDPFEEEFLNSLIGKTAFYVRNNVLFLVCENFTNLNFRPANNITQYAKAIEYDEFLNNFKPTLKKMGGQDYAIEFVSYDKKMMGGIFKTIVMSKAEASFYNEKYEPQNMDSPIKYILLKTSNNKDEKAYFVVFYKNGKEQKLEISEN